MLIVKNIFYIVLLIGQLYGAQNWTPHSAHLLPVQRWEMGVFQPFRYGYTETFEFSLHPLLFFIMPNLSFKVPHQNMGGWVTASRHSLIYPTPILNLVSKGTKIGNNIASLISPNFHIPPMIGISNDWVMSRSLDLADITLHGGIDLGIVIGDLDERSSIDLPLVYHRLGVYYNTWGLNLGLDIFRYLTQRFGIHADIDLRMLPGLNGNYDIEHKFLFIWNKSERFQLCTGYKFFYGQLPYGKQARLLPYLPLMETWIPIIEMQFARDRISSKTQ